MKKELFALILLISSSLSAQEITLNTLADTMNFYKSTAKPIDAFNSDKIDYAPSISADGKTMIVESNKRGKYELFESRKVDGEWTELIGLDNINNFGDSTDLVGGPSISFDGNFLFFFASFREGGMGREDIWYSEREGGDSWSEPKNIGYPINTSDYEGFPSISADGNTLYFVRQNYEGPYEKDLQKLWVNKACYSIYSSSRNPDGTWAEPEKMPYPINMECEKAPRIMADNKTIIFASNRLGGIGEYDLYQTQLDVVGDWQPPTALSYVNTPQTDQFASISAQGDLLYYVYDSKDIYSVEIPPHLRQFKNNVIQGNITNGDNGEGVQAEIVVSDAFTSKEIMKMTNNAGDGFYSVVLAVGNNYNIEIRKEGFTSQSFFYDLSQVDEYQEIYQDIQLYQSAQLNLNVFDIDIFEPISANIKVKIQGETSFITDVENAPDGKIVLDLPLGNTYEVIVDKENFNSEVFLFDVSDLVVYRDYSRDVEMTPIKRDVEINIADLTNNGRVRSRVRIRNRNRDEVIETDGNGTVALRVGDRYEIEATSDQGYAFNSTVIDVTPEGEDLVAVNNDGTTSAGSGTSISGSGASAGMGFAINLNLQPLKEGTNLTLKDILFASGSDQLDEISYVELQRVIDLMKENPTLNVEINAHSDDVGPADYNQRLSERRAQSVVRFMIENKVSEDRFTANGLGETQPIVPNDSPENRAKNRRVVLKIVAI